MVGIAERLGAAGLATGHYARIGDDGAGALLTAAADPAKDQTYMLAGLPPAALARLRFPLGGLTKPEVREIAAAAGLAVADKAESQDLCFLAGDGKAGFLARHGGLDDREGEVVDRPATSSVAIRATTASRSASAAASASPRRSRSTSSRTDAATNRVVVGGEADLDTRRVRIRDATLHRPSEPASARSSCVTARGRSPAGSAAPKPAARPPRPPRPRARGPRAGPAPGQTAVLCDGDLVVGHGTIA